MKPHMGEGLRVNIIGAGLSGLSAAVALAGRGIGSNLVSAQESERAQSVLAEGGINAALNTMGEDDSPGEHFEDTLKAGCFIEDEEAVRGLCEAAPGIVRWLYGLGVPFDAHEGRILQRNFGGQKKKRTAYAKSSVGKALMAALIDEARKYEHEGLIKRYAHYIFKGIILNEGRCCGARIAYDGVGAMEEIRLEGPVIAAFGGLNGFFAGHTTGTVTNTGDAAAALFSQGAAFSNLEMIQYHPTTFGIAGKKCLVSEAARGEGGRLFVLRDGRPWYFMEEKYPVLGNLMPRDIVSREIYTMLKDSSLRSRVYLDCTGIKESVWNDKLPDLRKEIRNYLGLDPAKKPIPVVPGIHYFMGGIDVDDGHETNIKNLFAAGECCSKYHGANRLGGNSTLGAIYGGLKAAGGAGKALDAGREAFTGPCGEALKACRDEIQEVTAGKKDRDNELCWILLDSLGIVRNEKSMEEALKKIELMKAAPLSKREEERLLFSKAMLLSALFRKESRGAHFRDDFPETHPEFRGKVRALYDGEDIHVELKKTRF